MENLRLYHRTKKLVNKLRSEVRCLKCDERNSLRRDSFERFSMGNFRTHDILILSKCKNNYNYMQKFKPIPFFNHSIRHIKYMFSSLIISDIEYSHPKLLKMVPSPFTIFQEKTSLIDSAAYRRGFCGKLHRSRRDHLKPSNFFHALFMTRAKFPGKMLGSFYHFTKIRTLCYLILKQ